MTTLSGERFRRLTSIKRLARGQGEELRILVRVDNGTRLGRLNPLAEDLIIATPTAKWSASTPRPSEGNDPRRYGVPRRGA